MTVEMTKDWLLERCKGQGLYRTPHLNDSLYLQCQALSEIQNLDEYTGVKQLHVEENCIESLNGVQPLKKLQSLYLTKNLVREIDHLEGLEDLDTLDLSQNCLSKLGNLYKCMKLRVLVVSHNLLDSAASISHLTLCPSIMILDLSHNKLKDGDGVLGVAKSLANLTVLYLSGNPFVAVFPHYRKTLIGSLAKLNHLDDRPVFWDERRYAEAWMRGGQEEEDRERDLVREMRAAEETLQFEAMRQLRCQYMEERQNVAPRPMLQFTPEELGEDVESLSCPPPEETDHPSSWKMGVQDGSSGYLERTGSRNIPTSATKVGKSFIEAGQKGQEQGECSTSYSGVEAHYCMEHDLMLAQDASQHWEADHSEEHDLMMAQDTNPPFEEDYFMDHDSMLSEDQNQLLEAHCSMKHDSLTAHDDEQLCHLETVDEGGSLRNSQGGEGRQGPSQPAAEGKHEGFSPESAPVVQTESNRWPAACVSTLQGLGEICLPAWETASQLSSALPLGNTTKDGADPPEVKPREDGNLPWDRVDERKSPLPPPPPQQQGSDSYEWNHYYNNPSFCGGQQPEDNFLLSLQGMNHMEPNCTKGKNSSLCGQQIDDNFLLSMQRMSHIELNCTKGTLSANFDDSKDRECDPASVC